MSIEVVNIDYIDKEYNYYIMHCDGYAYRNFFERTYGFYKLIKYGNGIGAHYSINEKTRDLIVQKYIEEEEIHTSATLTDYFEKSKLNLEQRSQVVEFIQSNDVLKTRIDLYHYYKNSFIKMNNYFNDKNSSDQINKKDPYPIATRYVYANDYYAIERYPFQIDINFDGLKDLKIWVPWTLSYYNTASNEFIIHYSDKFLQSKDDIYLGPIFFNQYANGKVCFGSQRSMYDIVEEVGNSTASFKIRYNALINEYFSGGWNYELTPRSILLMNTREFSENICASEASIEKYSTLYEFIHIDVEKFKEKLSNKNFNKFYNLVKNYNKIIDFHDYEKLAKYFFYVMSTYDLEKTLKFYGELKEYSIEFCSDTANNFAIKFEDTYDADNNFCISNHMDLTKLDKKLDKKENSIFSKITDTSHTLPNKSSNLENLLDYTEHSYINIYFYNIDFEDPIFISMIDTTVDYRDLYSENVGEYLLQKSPFIINHIIENGKKDIDFIVDFKNQRITPVSINKNSNLVESVCLSMDQHSKLVQNS
jgi:hypothetical protein